ncbi:MAG: NIPSNAP family protein [Bacteroidales bacterium]
MKRRKFITTAALGAAGLSTGFKVKASQNQNTANQLIEFREYQMKFGTDHSILETYLKNALIPALNKYGIEKAGVFREYSKTEPPKIFMVTPFPSYDEYPVILKKAYSDKNFLAAAAAYNSTPPAKIPFERVNTSLLNAFDRLPKIQIPQPGDKLFELRIYEGHNEDAVARKVGMFNKEEIDLFYKTGFKPVYFGQMIAGFHTPCLNYMVSFKDMAEREAIWAKFVESQEWKTMKDKPEYANSVSSIIRIFLEPMEYSQI